jgi:hypothetical protein
MTENDDGLSVVVLSRARWARLPPCSCRAPATRDAGLANYSALEFAVIAQVSTPQRVGYA